MNFKKPKKRGTGKKHSTSLYMCNVRGLKNKTDSMKLIINDLRPDIILLTETKATSNWVHSVVKEWGYTPVVKGGSNVNSGGMVIGTRTHLGSTTNTTASNHQNVFSVQMEMSTAPVRLIGAYGLQETDNAELRKDFFTELEIEIESAIGAGCIPIVMGDLNAKYLVEKGKRTPTTPNGTMLCEILETFSLHAANDHRSCEGYWTRQNRKNPAEKSVLDYVLFPKSIDDLVMKVTIDEELNHTPFGTGKMSGEVVKTHTDHNAIIVELCGKAKGLKDDILMVPEKWKLTEEGLEKFHDITDNGSCFENLDTDNPQDFYNQATEELDAILKVCFKKTKCQMKNENKKNEGNKAVQMIRKELKQMKKEGKMQRAVAQHYMDYLNKKIGETAHSMKAERVQNALINLTENDVHFSNNAFWKLKKKLGKNTDGKTSVVNSNGVEVFSDLACLKEYEREFYDRLSPREIDPLLIEYQEATNRLERILTCDPMIPLDEPDFVVDEVARTMKSLRKGKAVGMDLYPAEIYLRGGKDMVKMVTVLANMIKNKLIVPTQFFDTLITTIHKKGSVKILKNKRGVFLCIVISKILEKLIKQRIEHNLQQVNSLQAGSTTNRGCGDNTFLIRAVVDHAKYTGKSLYITVYDYTQCFDSLWLEDSLISLWKLGVSRQLLSIVKKMNETVKMVVNTPHGRTNERSLRCIVKQGSVLGSNLCSSSTGELADERTTGVNIGLVNIPCVIYVDDTTNFNDSANDTLISHNDTLVFKRKKRLSLSFEKCHIMVMNKKPREKLPSLMIGDHEMSRKRTVKIVGDNFNERGSNVDLIAERVKKGKSCVVNSIAMCSEIALGCFSLHILLLLYQAVFLASVLFNSQTWTRLTKSDLKKLLTIQLKYLKRTMHAPNSTPNVSVFLELGVLPITYEIDKRKLVFLHHILTLDLNDPVRRVYYEQLNLPCELNWANELQILRERYEVELSDNEIMMTSYDSWKLLVKKAVREVAFEELSQEAAMGSKSNHLRPTELLRQNYVTSLYPAEARILFRVRTKMISCKANHKGSYKDLTCRLCSRHPVETQQHLVNCDAVRGTDQMLVTLDDCYKDGFEADRDLVKVICSRLTKADELLKSANSSAAL